MTFEIDFFELAFLAEVCIPPAPIARSSFWMDLIDKHYPKMSKGQRKHLFEWITNKDGFDMKNRECKLFYDRFNPDNQCRILATDGNYYEVFKHEERYWVTSKSFAPENVIKEIDKI